LRPFVAFFAVDSLVEVKTSGCRRRRPFEDAEDASRFVRIDDSGAAGSGNADGGGQMVDQLAPSKAGR